MGYLQRDRVYACAGSNAMKDLHDQRPFHISLSRFPEAEEQKYLWLQAQEVEPMFLVANHQNPPLYPYLVAERQQLEEHFSENLELWLQRFFDCRGSDWQRYVFPNLEDQAWNRQILGQICNLYDPSKTEHENPPIALRLSFSSCCRA
jgi:hypothetical protein